MYAHNCAEESFSRSRKGVDGEIFNIVDEGSPTSREFLRMYKKHARYFRSIYMPGVLSYILCNLWEKYSKWSKEQLPPVFNREKMVRILEGQQVF